MIGWLIDNIYVIIGNTVFQQVIGISMGTDCAPYLANLFLFAYEFEFLNTTLKKKDLKNATVILTITKRKFTLLN